MLKYITEEEYSELLGKSVPNDFDILVIKASNYINHETFGRIDENHIPEEVKFVTCLIINYMEELEAKIKETQNLKSENIEGWSKTYATPEEITSNYTNKMKDVLSQYLWDIVGNDGKPLLYRGVC